MPMLQAEGYLICHHASSGVTGTLTARSNAHCESVFFLLLSFLSNLYIYIFIRKSELQIFHQLIQSPDGCDN